MRLAEYLLPTPSVVWTLAKQAGCTDAVCRLPDAWDANGPPPWDFLPLLQLKTRFTDAGLTPAAIEPAPPALLEPIKQGLPDREAHLEAFCQFIRNMGAVGIPVLCYNFMAGFGWVRTSTSIRTRGDALVSGYDHAAMRHAPPTAAGLHTDDQLWERYASFLERVVPVAAAAGVRLALHPDDPPVSPIRGIARIFRSVEALQRAVELLPSPAHGVTLCQGSIATMGADVPAAIRWFGERDKIHLVHFRDVRGVAERFEETFHDDGQTDMVAAMRAYREVGYRGPVRPDHVPTMGDEDNATPGYQTMGRLFALGYIKGLMESVDALG